jgi:hypothetical protein
MSTQDPVVIVADAVRERLAVVEAACHTLTSTAGVFRDLDRVYRDLAHMRTQIDLARQALLKSGLLS